MNGNKRPTSVVLATALVVAQIAISLAAAVTAWLAPADYRTLAATTPVVLKLGYAVVAFYLWVGHAWARILALAIAALGAIGNLSVLLYYDHTATVAMNAVGLVISVAILVLLMTGASRQYFGRAAMRS